MKKKIDVYEHMGEILKGVKSGVLVTGKDENKINSMTISWGMVGIEWGKPVFVTFIRESRFTRSLIEKNGEFTVNIPIDESAKKILAFCGSKSGRDVDKAKELGLTYEEPETISVPGIRELPLTLECKVIYKQTQDTSAMTEENREKFYPQNVDSTFTGSNRDTHVAYYGEIVNAYIID
ncbi:MAG: flavin reductase family protein [Eubacteriales bacterium]|nr:flavin reductase family protein [Eubacteriales bacterium]